MNVSENGTNVCYNVIYHLQAYNILKQHLYFWKCNSNNRLHVMTSQFEKQFMELLIIVCHNKRHFLNLETKLDKIKCYCKVILNLEIWPYMT